MVEPCVCEECGWIAESNPDRFGYTVCVDCWRDARPLPEPHDPDLGALHGVTTNALPPLVTQELGGEVRYQGPDDCAHSWGDDPTGERAFLRAVGEE